MIFKRRLLGNTGRDNIGNYNTGNRNTGDYNTRDDNNGDYNTGSFNNGDFNTGLKNNGTGNCGSKNSGNGNTGNNNEGHYNTGDGNGGCYNTGHYNIGYYNTGKSNIGNYNTGHYNIGNFNTGLFNTENSSVKMFDIEVSNVCNRYITKILVTLSKYPQVPYEWEIDLNMTTQERIDNPNYEITKGYLKKVKRRVYKESDIDIDDVKFFKSIPNFCPDKFFKCTGIDLRNNTKTIVIDGKEISISAESFEELKKSLL